MYLGSDLKSKSFDLIISNSESSLHQDREPRKDLTGRQVTVDNKLPAQTTIKQHTDHAVVGQLSSRRVNSSFSGQDPGRQSGGQDSLSGRSSVVRVNDRSGRRCLIRIREREGQRGAR